MHSPPAPPVPLSRRGSPLTHAACALISLAALSASRPALALPCDPAHVDSDLDALPAPWQRALSDLVQSTAREGLPWSCQGGRVSLALDADGAATLTVADASGRIRARHLAAPDDLVPMAEALLAKPLAPPPAPPPALPPPQRDQVTPTPTPTAVAEPRLLVDGTLGPRYAGATRLVWGGVGLRAVVPLGAWTGGVWVRYDGPAAEIDGDQHRPTPTEICLGVAAGRRFTTAPVELSASLDPSLAVITRKSGMKRDAPDTTQVDGRIGLSLRASVPIFRPVRVVLAIDGELAPGELRDHDHDFDVVPGERPPISFPTYTLGLSLGAELVLR